MKSDDIIITGLAGLTALALLSRKSKAITPIQQPQYNDCEIFERM